MSTESTILKSEGRVLSTLEQDGSRRWIYPRLSAGRFWHARRIVAYLLIAIYATLPFLKVNGKPAILLDIVRRKFTILGVTFLPTDTILLALLAVTTILSIFLVTALLGRVWCGWACPQTVYLEFLYRPLERLFLGRTSVGGKHKADVAGWRHAALYATYFAISLHLANTFLSYFVGAETLHTWILSWPTVHPVGFTIVVVETGLMMFNFSVFREQTCLIACPYGRLQSVLLDRQSLIISYDKTRGEPRGKMKRGDKARNADNAQDRDAAASIALKVVAEPSARATSQGDCIDCGLCQAVCPTGIDIRDGLQFECVGCAQCIDVCDDVMKKVNRPVGLIRYGSQAGMAGEKTKLLRPRVIIYPALMLVLGSLLAFLLLTRSAADVVVFRAPGNPFLLSAGGAEVTNVLRVKLTNRTDDPQTVVLSVAGPQGVTTLGGAPVILQPGEVRNETLEVHAPVSLFAGMGSAGVTVQVRSADAGGPVNVDRPFQLLGPATATATQRSQS